VTPGGFVFLAFLRFSASPLHLITSARLQLPLQASQGLLPQLVYTLFGNAQLGGSYAQRLSLQEPALYHRPLPHRQFRDNSAQPLAFVGRWRLVRGICCQVLVIRQISAAQLSLACCLKHHPPDGRHCVGGERAQVRVPQAWRADQTDESCLYGIVLAKVRHGPPIASQLVVNPEGQPLILQYQRIALLNAAPRGMHLFHSAPPGEMGTRASSLSRASGVPR
jgi:hypothetical protein